MSSNHLRNKNTDHIPGGNIYKPLLSDKEQVSRMYLENLLQINNKRQQHYEKDKRPMQVLHKDIKMANKHMKKLPIFLLPPPTPSLATGIG